MGPNTSGQTRNSLEARNLPSRRVRKKSAVERAKAAIRAEE
jgi:hypothetical protein